MHVRADIRGSVIIRIGVDDPEVVAHRVPGARVILGSGRGINLAVGEHRSVVDVHDRPVELRRRRGWQARLVEPVGGHEVVGVVLADRQAVG